MKGDTRSVDNGSYEVLGGEFRVEGSGIRIEGIYQRPPSTLSWGMYGPKYRIFWYSGMNRGWKEGLST